MSLSPPRISILHSGTIRTAGQGVRRLAGLKTGRQALRRLLISKAADQTNEIFCRNLYYLSILGTPSEKEPWMLQFGGHHLALNITIVGRPRYTHAQPDRSTARHLYGNGKTVRPLGQENDQGFALLNALDDAQRKQAILSYRVADLVLGPGHDGQTIQPKGFEGILHGREATYHAA